MAYTYATFVTTLANELPVAETAPEFVVVLPSIIQDAEERIYRDLQLLSTVVRDTSGVLVSNTREFTLPTASGRFVTVSGINLFTPVGTTTTRNQVRPATRDYLDAAWPAAASNTGLPKHFAPITDQLYIFGPSPDAGYTVEVIGTIRPAALSSSNSTTFLTSYLPDLFFAAAMIRAAAYQRNFGSQADDPKQALTWQATYDQRLASANGEEMRRKWAMQG